MWGLSQSSGFRQEVVKYAELEQSVPIVSKIWVPCGVAISAPYLDLCDLFGSHCE